jgi:hypothetical protein
VVKGLDYSGDHPDVGCVARSGYTFVVRYIGDLDPNTEKYLDAPELADIRAAGLSVVVVRESTAGFMIRDDGAAHARASRAHCDQLGLDDIPIYYALDVDPRGLTTVQTAAVARFLQDAAAADGGGHRVGLYGAYTAMERWVGQPFCWWGWQTYAWSDGRISGKAHFRQHLNGQDICGGKVDLNETYAVDFGQWPRPDKQGVSPATQLEDDEMAYLVKAPDRAETYLLIGNERLLINGEPALKELKARYGSDLRTEANGTPLVWPDWLIQTYRPRRPGVDDVVHPFA